MLRFMVSIVYRQLTLPLIYRSVQLLYLVLLFSCFVVAANPLATLKFERLSSDDGLSDNTVTVSYQDRQGFMWIGTTDGLNRYDGYQFRVFRHDIDDLEDIQVLERKVQPLDDVKDQIKSKLLDDSGDTVCLRLPYTLESELALQRLETVAAFPEHVFCRIMAEIREEFAERFAQES